MAKKTEFVKMRKDDETIEVFAGMVAEHERLGWSVVREDKSLVPEKAGNNNQADTGPDMNAD